MEAASESKGPSDFTQLSKNKHPDLAMEQNNKRLTANCQICSSKFTVPRSARKVCSPCRGWILHIRGLYREMHQIMELTKPIEVVTIDDDDNADGEFQEPEVITLDD